MPTPSASPATSPARHLNLVSGSPDGPTTERSLTELPPGSAHHTRLDLPADLTFDEWQETGQTLGRMARACQWWIGDWLNYGEKAYGEKYAQAMEATGLDYSAVANYAWVSKSIEPSTRVETLSWSHHREVAKLAPPDQGRWLTSAEANGWSKGKLRIEMRSTRETPARTFDIPAIDTARQRALAEKAKERVWTVITKQEGYATGMDDGTLRVDRALAVTDPAEVRQWMEILDKSAKASTELRKALQAQLEAKVTA